MLFNQEWDIDSGAWRSGSLPSAVAPEGSGTLPSPNGSNSAILSDAFLAIEKEEGTDINEAPGVLEFLVQMETNSAEYAASLARLTAAATTFGENLNEKATLAQELAKNPAAPAKQKQELADATALQSRCQGG